MVDVDEESEDKENAPDSPIKIDGNMLGGGE